MTENNSVPKRQQFILFLEPWSQLSDQQAAHFEKELSRELAPHHSLFGRRCGAIAQTGASDDVLFQLDDGTFAQVHLTFTRDPPEPPAWPWHKAFGSLAEWMLEVMIGEHIDHFGLW